MKIICNQQILAKALNTVSKAVTNKTTIPVLKGILLKALPDGRLFLSASDLDISIEKSIDVKVEEAGSVVVLSRLFNEIIRKLPNEDLLIEKNEQNIVTIKSSFSDFSVVGLSADEFPSLGEIEKKEEKIVINSEMFKNMIKKTSFAASIDETKGVIVGSLIEIEKNSINMVALDGFRMAVVREEMKSREEKKVIIPSRILNEVGKIISESEESEEKDIEILLGEKKAVVYIDDVKVIIRILEGEFIKYRGIIPNSYKCRVFAERDALTGSIERAALLAREGKNNLIKMEIRDDVMYITSRSEEGNVREELLINKEGEDIEIGFNSKYVLDVLKVLEEEKIVMEFNTNINPCLIKPLEGNRYEYLLLPVRITGRNV